MATIKLIECPRDAMQGWKHFIETENKINSSLGTKLKSIFTSKSLNQYIPHQPTDHSDNLESVN